MAELTATRLVADVGGTNTRVGLARNGEVQAGSVRRYGNDDFTGLVAVVEDYLSAAGAAAPLVGEIVVAVAGPVSAGGARLTNRDWTINAADLSARFGKAPVVLLNDLTALGLASRCLAPHSLDCLLDPGPPASGSSDQSLVVGIGTGFNLSPVLVTGEGVQCLRAEAGHVHLPLGVAERLADRFGAAASSFRTVEQVFSGRGFVALSALFAGPGADPAAASRDPAFRDFYAGLLALLARDLMLAYLPTGGIYFAGGVARGLLSSAARAEFVRQFSRPFAPDPGLSAPVLVILDDAAALLGCARSPLPG